MHCSHCFFDVLPACYGSVCRYSCCLKDHSHYGKYCNWQRSLKLIVFVFVCLFVLYLCLCHIASNPLKKFWLLWMKSVTVWLTSFFTASHSCLNNKVYFTKYIYEMHIFRNLCNQQNLKYFSHNLTTFRTHFFGLVQICLKRRFFAARKVGFFFAQCEKKLRKIISSEGSQVSLFSWSERVRSTELFCFAIFNCLRLGHFLGLIEWQGGLLTFFCSHKGPFTLVYPTNVISAT